MADLRGSYDENAEPSSGEFEPIPAGGYRAVIIESSIEDVSKNNNNGRCLVLKWQIETGPYANRLVWQRLNIWFDGKNSQKVRSIAESQFAAVRQATGVSVVNDSEELHHRPCDIRVAVKQSEGYPAKNEVTSVKPAEGMGSVQNRQPPAGGQRQAPQTSGQRNPPSSSGGNGGGSATAPWRNKQRQQVDDEQIPF